MYKGELAASRPHGKGMLQYGDKIASGNWTEGVLSNESLPDNAEEFKGDAEILDTEESNVDLTPSEDTPAATDSLPEKETKSSPGKTKQGDEMSVLRKMLEKQVQLTKQAIEEKEAAEQAKTAEFDQLREETAERQRTLEKQLTVSKKLLETVTKKTSSNTGQLDEL